MIVFALKEDASFLYIPDLETYVFATHNVIRSCCHLPSYVSYSLCDLVIHTDHINTAVDTVE